MNYRELLLVVFSFITIYSVNGQIAVRGGLPNFYSKIAKEKDICVTYFGGSITAQPGWRVQSMNYLQKKYPNVAFKEHDATIGGTGSDLGVFRMDYDVLRVKPDLLFVEFAVNDSQTDSLLIQKSMEGIVRKTWKTYPDCDICFVYTFHEPLLVELLSGRLNESVRVMEVVAQKYNIPSFYLGDEALRLIKEGKMKIKPVNGIQTKVSGDDLNESFTPKAEADGIIYFAPDGVHPYLNTGHVLYTRTLIKGLELCEKEVHQAMKHKLSKPLSKNDLEYSSPLYPEQLKTGEGWIKDTSIYNSFSNRFKSLWKANQGTKLSLQMKGVSLVAYDLLGPGSCKLKVTVDGTSKEITRFDGYCTYWRIGSVVLAEGLDPNVVHNISIEVEKLDDKKTILFEGNKADVESNPAKYQESAWFVGNFFLTGKNSELIK